jgi:hypothetical protein
MKKPGNLNILLILALAISVFSCQKELTEPDLTSDGKGSTTLTEQSIMMDGTTDEAFILDGKRHWKFDRLAAAKAEYAYDLCTTNSCREQAKEAAWNNRCTYWEMPDHPYWYIFMESGTFSMDLTVELGIAGLSWMSNRTFPMPGKYSFSLLDKELMPRIENLTYSVDGGPAIPLEILSSDVYSGIDFKYEPNAFVSLAGSMADVSGKASGILKSDVTDKNDDISNAWIAKKSFTLYGLTKDVTIDISGTVKGNDGAASITFKAKKQVVITAQGCHKTEGHEDGHEGGGGSGGHEDGEDHDH